MSINGKKLLRRRTTQTAKLIGFFHVRVSREILMVPFMGVDIVANFPLWFDFQFRSGMENE